ncbi:protein farnesyltransferase/ geranylgeranyltransferase type-1 subunit alpha [Clonorchis sinensis]|uniref:Protein farnesyltransferase/geranylgeranyltransferase type-1 subunit alpha n=1 Tax=Clonorchis sinensis TaxID=79923 RepID=H2KV28_CLOSI|nr:protein farnesyltransferase/ geranylgeranyltransferase type-1 subunit alpha [Clonorchis sinensis]
MKYRDRYVFYKDRPEWADVVPVPQDEGERNVVRIAYSPQFVDAHDYMRAVLLKDERSERALEITGTVLLLNPANFTVWEYRRRILTSLRVDLVEELQLTGKLIDEHSKNYQLWHHRQWIATQLAEQSDKVAEDEKRMNRQSIGQEELDFTDTVISDDSKNYHAWQYRRWVVTYFGMPSAGELQYTDRLIQEDMYNNSAWNHRFVVVTKDEGLTPPVLQREIDFVQRIIRAAPNNESSWNYLYGLLVPSPCVVASGSSYSKTNKSSPRPDLVGFNTASEVVDETVRSTSPVGKPDSNPRMTKLVIRPPSAANLRAMRKFAEELAAADAVAANSVALLGFLVEVYADCIQARVEGKTQNGYAQLNPDLASGEASSKFQVRTSGDAKAAAAGNAGVDILLSNGAEASLLGSIPVDGHLCVVGLATSVYAKRAHLLVTEKVADPEIKRNFQNQFLERLPNGPISDIKGHPEKIPKAAQRQIIPGRNHNFIRRIIRCQVTLSVRADRKAWWTRKAEEMKDAKSLRNVR